MSLSIAALTGRQILRNIAQDPLSLAALILVIALVLSVFGGLPAQSDQARSAASSVSTQQSQQAASPAGSVVSEQVLDGQDIVLVSSHTRTERMRPDCDRGRTPCYKVYKGDRLLRVVTASGDRCRKVFGIIKRSPWLVRLWACHTEVA